MTRARGRPPAVSGDGTPDRIRDAALRLFHTQGFRASTMRQIATACGLTPGAIYNHYGSKEQILYSIIARAHDEAESDVRSAIAMEGRGPYERLRATLVALAMRHTRFPEAARVSERDHVFLAEPHLSEIRARRRAARTLFERLIQDGIADGTIRLPMLPNARPELVVRIAAISIFNMSVMIAEWYRAPGPLSGRAVSELHADLALQLLGVGLTRSRPGAR